jgi:hypothetical protein
MSTHPRTLLVVAAAVALSAAACSSAGTAVVVTVDASHALTGVAQLQVVASVGTTSRSYTFNIDGGTIPPARSFAIDVPASVSGTLAVQVTAIDSASKALGAGQGSSPLAPGKREDIAITLNAGPGGGDDAGAGSDGGGGNGDAGGSVGGLTYSPSMMSFGPIDRGTSAATQTLTVHNGGADAVTFGAPTLGGSDAALFALDSVASGGCAGATIPTGSDCTVVLHYAPTAAGAHTASLTIGAVTVPLTGSALPVWEKQTVGLDGNLEGITGSVANDLWIVGHDSLKRTVWVSSGDGKWTVRAPAFKTDMFGIFAWDSTHVCAVGKGQEMDVYDDRNGSLQWSEVSSDAAQPDWIGAWMASSHDFFAAGGGGQTYWDDPVVTHGGIPIVDTTTRPALKSIWGKSATDLGVAGGSQLVYFGRIDPASWSGTTVPGVTGQTICSRIWTDAHTDWFVACRDSGNNVWVQRGDHSLQTKEIVFGATANPGALHGRWFSATHLEIYLASGATLWKSIGDGTWTSEKAPAVAAGAILSGLWLSPDDTLWATSNAIPAEVWHRY